MEVLLTGIGVLCLLLVIGYMWQPTMLDTARDELFDLRDIKLKGFFINKEHGLNNKTYAELRQLINRYLRYTEVANVWSLTIAYASLKAYEKREGRLPAINNISSDDEETNEFIKTIRCDCALIMVNYVVRRSFFIYVLFYSVAITCAAFYLISRKKVVKAALESAKSTFRNAVARNKEEVEYLVCVK